MVVRVIARGGKDELKANIPSDVHGETRADSNLRTYRKTSPITNVSGNILDRGDY